MLQQKQPTSITSQLQQQGTQLLLKISQWLLDRNSCFHGLAWDQTRLPPNYPLAKGKTNLITFCTRQRFPIQLAGPLSVQLCNELHVDNKSICLFANRLPDGSAEAALLIPDIKTLLQQPQVQAWLNQQNQPPAQAPNVPNAQPITAPPTQLRNRFKKTTAQESVPHIQEVKHPREEERAAIKERTPKINEAKKKKSSEKRVADTHLTHSSAHKNATAPHHPTMEGAPFRLFSTTSSLPSNAPSQQETWETNKKQVKQLLALGNILLPIQVDLLNHFPYWQTLQDKNGCQQWQHSYQQHQMCFKQQSTESERQITPERLKALIVLQRNLFGWTIAIVKNLSNRLHNLCEKIKEENQLHIALDTCSETLDTITQASLNSSQQHDSLQRISEETLQKLNKAWVDAITTIRTLKKECPEHYSFNPMKRRNFHTALNFSKEAWLTLKFIQHEIVAYKNASKLIANTPAQLILTIAPATHWLNKADYSDVFLLHHIVSDTTHIEEGLQNQRNLYRQSYLDYQQQHLTLYQYWQEQLAPILRCQRTIDVYKQWEHTLAQLIQQLGNLGNPSWTTLITLYRHLSYDKKSFFIGNLAQQQGVRLIETLARQLQQNPDLKNPQNAFMHFREEKNRLKEKLQHQKEALTKTHQLWEKAAAFLELAISQQPDFQIGSVSTQLQIAALDYPENSYLFGLIGGNVVPEPLVRKAAYLGGLGVLSIGLWFTNWVGYTYHTIMGVNRVALAQFDAWLQMGEQLDKILQPCFTCLKTLTPSELQTVVTTLENMLQFDEVGLVENDAVISWLMGIGVNALLQGGFSLPATAAYTAATAGANLASRGVEYIAEECEFPPKLIQALGFIMHLVAYPYSYRLGYHWGNALFTPPQQRELSAPEAFQTLGLTNQATEEGVKSQYRLLSREHHPDKCCFFCQNPNPEDRANDVRSCEETCKTENKKTMATLNQAYGVLMKKMQ